MKMFKKIPQPVLGGLVREGMGTRIHAVLDIVPHSRGGWLCGILALGHWVPERNGHPGYWQDIGNTQCSGYGGRNIKWVYVSQHTHRHACVVGDINVLSQRALETIAVVQKQIAQGRYYV